MDRVLRLVTLTLFELQLMWSDFQLSLRQKHSLGNYIAVAAILTIFTSMTGTVFAALGVEGRYTVLTTLQTLDLWSWASIGLGFWLLYYVAKGPFVWGLTRMFARTDVNVLFPSPASPSEIYVAKYVRSAIRRGAMIGVAYLVAFPVLRFLQLEPLQQLAFFGGLFLFVETAHSLEYLTGFAVQKLLLLRPRRLLLAFSPLPFLLGLLLLSMQTAGVSERVAVELSPPTVLSRLFAETFSSPYHRGVIVPALLFLTAVYWAVFALSAMLVSTYYDSVITSFETPYKLGLNLFPNRLRWRITASHEPSITILLKDFWIQVRERGKGLVAGVVTGVALAALSLAVEPAFEPLFAVPREALGIVSVIMIIAIGALVAASAPLGDLFLKEYQELWILKTAPIKHEAIVSGKYLYALIITLLFSAPLITPLYLAIPGDWQRFQVLSVYLPIVAVMCGIGVAINAHFPPPSRDRTVLPFVAYLGFLVASVVVSLLLFTLFPGRPTGPPRVFFANMQIALVAGGIVFLCLKVASEGFTSRLGVDIMENPAERKGWNLVPLGIVQRFGSTLTRLDMSLFLAATLAVTADLLTTYWAWSQGLKGEINPFVLTTLRNYPPLIFFNLSILLVLFSLPPAPRGALSLLHVLANGFAAVNNFLVARHLFEVFPPLLSTLQLLGVLLAFYVASTLGLYVLTRKEGSSFKWNLVYWAAYLFVFTPIFGALSAVTPVAGLAVVIVAVAVVTSRR